MSATRRLVVEDGSPTRVDAFVRAALPGASRTVVRRLIADGAVRVNGRRVPKGLRLAPGDDVVLPATAALEPEPATPLAVLHVDARVIAVDKPGGVAGHALDPRQRGTVAAALLARWPALAGVGDPLAPGLVHRLDTGTSGVLLAARTAEAFDALRALFRAHAVRKRYVAVVRGAPRPGTRIDAPLAHDTRDRRRMVAAGPGARAWPAETTIVAVHPCGDVSRIDVEIRTGVTHQIRAHLALAGHPVVGDALYGGPPATTLAPGRHALHAARVEIPSWPLEVEAPLPADVRDLAGRG